MAKSGGIGNGVFFDLFRHETTWVYFRSKCQSSYFRVNGKTAMSEEAMKLSGSYLGQLYVLACRVLYVAACPDGDVANVCQRHGLRSAAVGRIRTTARNLPERWPMMGHC
jgi:hypothetical protein